jgi:hypothetical protein
MKRARQNDLARSGLKHSAYTFKIAFTSPDNPVPLNASMLDNIISSHGWPALELLQDIHQPHRKLKCKRSVFHCSAPESRSYRGEPFHLPQLIAPYWSNGVVGNDGAPLVCGGSEATINTMDNGMPAKLIIFERTNPAPNVALQRLAHAFY